MEKIKVRFWQGTAIKEVIINKSQLDLIHWMYDNDFDAGFEYKRIENVPENISEGYLTEQPSDDIIK